MTRRRRRGAGRDQCSPSPSPGGGLILLTSADRWRKVRVESPPLGPAAWRLLGVTPSFWFVIDPAVRPAVGLR